MDKAMVERLRTAAGAHALELARALLPLDPLAAATRLRSAGVDPDLAAAALTQAGLRHRATAKFGPDAAHLFFTRTGLEQATRRVVADRRAARLAAAGVTHIADLGCGIGADTLAFARAGLRVRAVEADPTTAAVAHANIDASGYQAAATVSLGDATTAELSAVDAVFCDPARRGSHGRTFNPADYTPPWEFVSALPARVPATVLKLAPGIDHALIPAGAEAQWVSVGGDVVEAALWHGPLAAVPRRATVITTAGTGHELTGSGTVAAPVGTPRRYLYDPDGAVVRAHLVAEFASTVDGVLADKHIAYVFSDVGVPSPFGTRLEVVTTLPYGLKPLRAALRAHDIGALEIRKRGLAVEPDHLRRELRLTGSASATLVLARLGPRPTAFLCVPTH